MPRERPGDQFGTSQETRDVWADLCGNSRSRCRMSAGQTGQMTGQMGHVQGTDGTQTRGCSAKILYVYCFFLSPSMVRTSAVFGADVHEQKGFSKNFVWKLFALIVSAPENITQRTRPYWNYYDQIKNACSLHEKYRKNTPWPGILDPQKVPPKYPENSPKIPPKYRECPFWVSLRTLSYYKYYGHINSLRWCLWNTLFPWGKFTGDLHRYWINTAIVN